MQEMRQGRKRNKLTQSREDQIRCTKSTQPVNVQQYIQEEKVQNGQGRDEYSKMVCVNEVEKGKTFSINNCTLLLKNKMINW